MRGAISSAWTFPMKYLFPPVWIGGFGIGTLDMWLQPKSVVFNDTPGTLPPSARWWFLAMWLLISAFILWGVARLKRVRLDGDTLLVSNYLREIRVPLTQVVHITQNRWVNGRPITVQCRVETPFGRRITFVPRSRFYLAPWNEDPLVGELRTLAGISSRAT